MKKKKISGFTLAEIIISMSIIGIIAAITIPALLVSTSEKALKAQKKALLARVSQAMSQIEDLRIYKLQDTSNKDQSSALNFITNGLAKSYRITKTCDKENLFKNCDFPEEITTQNGNLFYIKNNKNLVSYLNNTSAADAQKFAGLDTDVAGFVTANGEVMAIFYNPNCHGNTTNGFYSGNAATAMCLNMIYDLNGASSAPNEVGKDIGFITVFFPKDPNIVAPTSYAEDVSHEITFDDYATATQACKKQDSSLIIPTWEEGMAIALNKQLTGVESGEYLVSGAGSTNAYKVNVDELSSGNDGSIGSSNLRCVYND